MMITRKTKLTRISRCLPLVAILLAGSWSSARGADVITNAGPLLRYMVVLKSEAEGRNEPDIRGVGGRELSRWKKRRVVELPLPALEQLSRHPEVAYLALVDDGQETDAPRYIRGTAGDSVLRIQTDTEDPLTWDSGLYTYDGAGNIASIGPYTYRYDGAQRLVRATIDGETIDYKYDSFGNQIEREIGTATVLTPTSLRSNQLANTAYDRAGNQLGDIGETQAYRYDAANMMTERKTLPSTRRYIYTADDERIGVTTGSDEWTWTIRDFSGRVLSTYASTDPDASFWEWRESYHYDGSRLTSGVTLDERLTSPGNSRYFHLDHLGSPRLITNQNGRMISRHEYYPFGKEQTLYNQEIRDWYYSAIEPMKFTGHERDFATTVDSNVHDYLDYMHARFYSPSWGRFLSVDPYLDTKKNLPAPQRWNRYAYVTNNPVKFVDPNGADAFAAFFLGEQYRNTSSIDLLLEPGFTNDLTNAWRDYWDSDLNKAETIAYGVLLGWAGYRVAAGMIGGSAATATGTTVLLGENMAKRVGPLATRMNAGTFNQPWTGNAEDMMAKNMSWLQGQISAGARIFDIGRDMARADPSKFYSAEVKLLQDAGYVQRFARYVMVDGKVEKMFEWVKEGSKVQ